MDPKRILALAVMMLVASYANTYLGKSSDAPCELTEIAATEKHEQYSSSE